MKFLTQALALALISISSVEARQSFSKHDFDQAVASGQVNQEKLLKNAIPYKQSVRRRAQDGEDERNQDGYAGTDYEDTYQGVEVTSNFRLQFNSCLTLETENYNLLLDNLVNYAKDGTLVSVRNYVLFDLCDGTDCEPQTFMVDLTTFIEAVMDYGPARKSMVCSACATYGEDVCGKTYYNSAGYNNQGRRDLANKEYEVFDENTCSLCEKYDCSYDSEGDQQVNFASIEGWIAEIAECKQNEVQWKGLNTYSGWMCNADGSGIEIGVFIDRYCRMYNRQLNYVSMMADQDYQYFFQSKDIIPYMFTDIIECHDISSVTYVDQATYESVQSSYSQGTGTVSDACSLLFMDEAVPRSLSYCGQARNYTDAEYAQQQAYFAQNYQQNANNNAYANNKYNQNYYSNGNGNNQANQANQAQYNGQNMYQYIQAQSMMYNNYGQDMSWYTYDLTAFEVMDGAAVCQKVKSKWSNAGYSTGKSAVQDSVATSSATGIQNVYSGDTSSESSFWKWSNGDKSSSGSTNNTSSASADQPTWLFPTRNQHSSLQTPNTNLSPLEIAWIVLLSVGATAMFMHFTRKQVLKRRARKMIEKEVYIKTDDQGVPSPPLIIS